MEQKSEKITLKNILRSLLICMKRVDQLASRNRREGQEIRDEIRKLIKDIQVCQLGKCDNE